MERMAAVLSLVTALAVLVAILLGPLGLGVVRFHMNRSSIVQYQGSEVAMLLVTIGLLVSAWLWLSNTRLAASLSLGLSLFVIYTMLTVILAQEYQQFPDANFEKFFLLYAAITSLATVLMLLGFNAILGSTLHTTARWTTITKWTLGIQAGLFALLWLAQIANIYRSGLTPELAEARLLFWLVKYLDLGFVIPAALISIVLVQYRQPMAGMLVLGISGFITIMLVAIAAMTISSWAQNEPEGVLILAAGMLVLALPSALVWWHWATVARTG